MLPAVSAGPWQRSQRISSETGTTTLGCTASTLPVLALRTVTRATCRGSNRRSSVYGVIGIAVTSQYGVPGTRLRLPLSLWPVMPTLGLRPGNP